MIRNCPRCLRDFPTSAKSERVCCDCRKPKRRQPPDILKKLTPRENQIIALIQEGRQNREIALALHLTVGTVKDYVHVIFRKTAVSNRTMLAVWSLNPTRPQK